ncbi:MAG: DNA-directed DNA polymerase II small subunit [Nanoarchaeota archaeon]|nr:DNA-directed DNA polymerase II small subunit [Nanoarchaeota archaeon]
MENIIKRITEKGFLVSSNLKINEKDLDDFLKYLLSLENKPFIVSNDTYNDFLKSKQKEYVIIKKHEKRPEIPTKVKLRKIYNHTNKKIDINDWVAYYYDRFNKISNILKNRDELRSATTISRVKKINGRQQVALIGMIKDIRKTFTGTTIFELEDPTGFLKVIVKGDEAVKKVDELVLDEVIGVIGTKSKDVVYADKIIFPDIPERPIKKAKEEVYAAFISDTHVGSNMFLAKEFSHFIKWLKGEIGTPQQREIAKKVRYLFVIGDLVDGIGVYPNQEKELSIHDIYRQYEEFSKYFVDIPEDINIIVIPGNHDALRLAEPQHVLFQDIAEPVYKINNVIMASNPAVINIHNIDDFPGFDVLLYHGMSFDNLVSNVPFLRKYGYERADLIMEFLLKKRHLAPSHGSTLINPMAQDFLVIDKPVDIFASGHIHYTKLGRYKNVLTIGTGCFQEKTPFQEKLGHNPTPGRVPIVNLKSFQARIMKFR